MRTRPPLAPEKREGASARTAPPQDADRCCQAARRTNIRHDARLQFSSLRLELGRDGMLQRYLFSGAAMFACLWAATTGRAQMLPNYKHPDYLSPGMIGAQALMSGAPL